MKTTALRIIPSLAIVLWLAGCYTQIYPPSRVDETRVTRSSPPEQTYSERDFSDFRFDLPSMSLYSQGYRDAYRDFVYGQLWYGYNPYHPWRPYRSYAPWDWNYGYSNRFYFGYFDPYFDDPFFAFRMDYYYRSPYYSYHRWPYSAYDYYSPYSGYYGWGGYSWGGRRYWYYDPDIDPAQPQRSLTGTRERIPNLSADQSARPPTGTTGSNIDSPGRQRTPNSDPADTPLDPFVISQQPISGFTPPTTSSLPYISGSGTTTTSDANSSTSSSYSSTAKTDKTHSYESSNNNDNSQRSSSSAATQSASSKESSRSSSGNNQRSSSNTQSRSSTQSTNQSSSSSSSSSSNTTSSRNRDRK